MVKYQYQVLCREKKQKRAFSLVELSIVVGVIGVLLGGIWILMVQGSQTAERQQVLQQVGVVVENVRDYYAGQLGVPASGAAYSFLSNAVTLGLVPTYMVRPAALAATTCTNPTALCADGPWGSALDPDTHGSFRVCPWTPGAVPLASVTGGCLQGAVAGTTTSFFFVFSLGAR